MSFNEYTIRIFETLDLEMKGHLVKSEISETISKTGLYGHIAL